MSLADDHELQDVLHRIEVGIHNLRHYLNDGQPSTALGLVDDLERLLRRAKELGGID